MQEDTCEIQVRDGWSMLTIEQALELNPSLPKRCPECRGQVRGHRASSNGMRAHFEHIQAHPGCSRSTGTLFAGTRTLHPHPME